MNDNQSSYRKIMKATSLFGGVQVFNILITIIRSKFIALFLGSTGMGIVGLLNSTIGLIGGFTNFGLGTSAVRDVSIANNTGNEDRIGLVVSVLRRWVWITGALGAIIVLLLSPWLSQITFGNNKYVLSFALISITLFFNQLSVGQLAVLQGLQKVQYLAKASLMGSMLGLVITVPIYYFFRIDGIVPSLIVVSIISYIISRYYANKVHISKQKITKDLALSEGKNMLKMGFLISLSGLFVLTNTYLIQLFITSRGGVEQVGLFTAGFAVINTYVGLIFTAMGTDYYPRLSAIAESNELCRKIVNQQAEVSILILGPIIIVFLVFIKLIIIILYSNKFVEIEGMVLWLAIAVFFKAVAWCIGFLLLAKGASRTFFLSEFIANFYMLLFDLIGYYFWGLTGLGISFCLGYTVCLMQVFFITKTKYKFSLDSTFLKIFAFQFSLAISCFLVVKNIEKPYSYFIGCLFIIISVWHAYIELDKRLGLRTFLDNFIQKRKNS